MLDPAEPLPPGVTDVSAGGTFPFDARDGEDGIAAPCATAAGPEARFQIAVGAPEVVYFDTFGSAGNPAIAIYSGGCAKLGASEACADDTCGGMQAQGAWKLGAGAHCIVVDHAGAPDGAGQLQVIRGRHDGDPLAGRAGSVSGDTCMDDDSNDADDGDFDCGSEPGRDHHYFFTLCPAETVMARVDTCGAATFDTVLQIRDGRDIALGCDDDDDDNGDPTGACNDLERSRLATSVTGAGLFWAIVDGYDDLGEPNPCGTYTMNYQL